VDHLHANGFKVDRREITDSELHKVKTKHGVPDALFSCHTAIIDGYVIEGHVPADLIARLLKEKPAVAGLGVPGMPIGSPGMEGPNPQPYEVFAFDKKGQVRVYARR
jgi:hypothetical protein